MIATETPAKSHPPGETVRYDETIDGTGAQQTSNSKMMSNSKMITLSSPLISKGKTK